MPVAAPVHGAPRQRKKRARRAKKAAAGDRAQAVGERGQATVELPLAAMLWTVAFFVVCGAILAGVQLVFARHAAHEGARAMSVQSSQVVASQAARDALPSWFESGYAFSANGSRVNVSVKTRTIFPGGFGSFTVRQSADYTKEPNA